MNIKELKVNILIIFIFLSCIAACAQKESPKETITICDSGGCAERPRNYSSFDPAENAQEESDGKIAALETMAASDPRAAYDLALRYFRGDGVRQDSYLSIKWMREAAERGNFDAQKALGRLYLTGLGEMGSDPGEAEKWLSITTSRGDKEANDLLREAIAARQSEQAQYLWYRRWRPIFYNYWYYRYPYYSYWRGGRWYWY